MNVVFGCIIALLSVIGLATVIRAAVFAIYRRSWKGSLVHVVALSDADAELEIRQAVEQLNWYGFCVQNTLLAVDTGLDGDNRKRSELICSDYGIPLCYPRELIRIIGYTGEDDGNY